MTWKYEYAMHVPYADLSDQRSAPLSGYTRSGLLFYLVTAAACIIFTACAESSAPSSELSYIEPQLIEQFSEYEPSFSAWDAAGAPSPTKSVDLEDFVQSLLPFVEYALYGTRFPDEEAMGRELNQWITDHVFVEDEIPDPFLFALMNVILHPPAEFEEAIETDVVTGSVADGFGERHLEDYVWLARLWLEANEEQRPDSLTVR